MGGAGGGSVGSSADATAAAAAAATVSSLLPPVDIPPSLRWALSDGGSPSSGSEKSLAGRVLKKATLVHSLYEFTLMRALEDLLTATVVLPGFAQAWRRAGDALGELQHFNSAIEYYEVAARLDASLAEVLLPVIERLRVIENIVSNAEAKGWSKETIRQLVEDVRTG